MLIDPMGNKTKPIYYFTGTGGSLATARRIIVELPEFELVPIAALQNERMIDISSDSIGLVFPLYYAGLPRIVAGFVRKLKFSRPCHVFAVVTCGFPWSGWAMHQLQALLTNKKQRLAIGCYLQMVDNFLPHYDVPVGEEMARVDARYDQQLEAIIGILKKRERYICKESAIHLYAMYPFFIRLLKRYDMHFGTDGRCNTCGVCQKVCPVGNIVLQDDKPVWKHQCEFCLACINYCPQRTIQWKNVTQKKGRYHFKGISAPEVTRQKERV